MHRVLALSCAVWVVSEQDSWIRLDCFCPVVCLYDHYGCADRDAFAEEAQEREVNTVFDYQWPVTDTLGRDLTGHQRTRPIHLSRPRHRLI